MTGMKERIMQLVKKDTILVVSGLLMLLSLFFVVPDKEYVHYVNYRVLAILFSLMLVVGALDRIGTFRYLTSRLLGRIHSERSISLFLTLLAFFLSMLLTNDVALVTLVPFALLLLSAFGDRRRTVYTLILMTVGANLGSMLTPIGNPQNLYLYTEYHFSLSGFFRLMLPYSLTALILLILAVFLLNRTDQHEDTAAVSKHPRPEPGRLTAYLILFTLCLFTVAGALPYWIMLAAVSLFVFLLDRGAFRKVDYSLLLTFVFFFILIGNLGRIPAIRDTLTGIVDRHTVLTAVLSSQVISNVPAAMLLSAFTGRGSDLVIGANLGGLGTLIASMASLITYKFHAREKQPGDRYLLRFTIINLLFLAVLFGLFLLIG